MKIAIINDTHFGGRNDSQNLYHIQREFFEKQFFPYLKKNNIDQIIHAGDIFCRRKYINFRSLDFFNEVFVQNVVKENIKVDIIVGNHDVFWKDNNNLNSPNLLINHLDNFNIFIDTVEQEYDGRKILLCPWLCRENFHESMKLVKKTDAEICIGHFEFNGFNLLPGVKSEDGMSKKEFEKFYMVLSGHYHTKSDDGQVFYLGAQYPMNWSDYDDPKFFHILDTEKMTLKAIKNKREYYHKVVYNDKENDYNKFNVKKYDNCHVKMIIEQRDKPLMYENLINRFHKSDVEDLKIIEKENFEYEEDEADFDEVEDMMTVLNSYVSNITLEDDEKTKVKSLMSNLYTEALSED